MGCSTSTSQKVPRGSCLILEEAKGHQLHEIYFKESRCSFRSMDGSTGSAGGPPVAVTHSKHVERLDRFLERTANNSSLPLEVNLRREKLSQSDEEIWLDEEYVVFT
ncbi:unnamed protein product [Effrenium voratum]|nr:unnamed protein product [Effrenium voratum]